MATKSMIRRLTCVAMISSIAACANTRPKSESEPAPPSRSNPARTAKPATGGLVNVPPAYKDGYSDGCTSTAGGRKRDDKRYLSDRQYGLGWRDGFNLCRNR